MSVKTISTTIACAMFFLIIGDKSFSQSQTSLSPEMYGAHADAAIIRNCSIYAGSFAVNARDVKFSESDIGKIIFINGAGTSGQTLISTIQKVSARNTIILTDAAATSVINDTATFGTDCTNAFMQMNNNARSASNKNIVITFQKGIYLTKFNNWLAGIKNVTINGNDASVMCTNGAYSMNGLAAGNISLYTPAVFENIDNNYYSNKWASNTSFGVRINSAKASTDKIKLLDKDSITNFKTGNWIMLYGFEQENSPGYPPDERYFEFKKIKDINIKTGEIEFMSALANNYDSGWPDSTWLDGVKGIGAARIINCNRPSFNIIENLTVNDLHFIAFPGWKGKYATEIRNGRVQLYGVLNAKLQNVSCSGLYVGTSKNIFFKNCNISAEAEPDKEVENLSFENCNIKRLIGARGIDTLSLFNSTFNGEFTASPRVLKVSGCTFNTVASGSSSSLANFGFNGGTDMINIGANTWNCNDDKRSFLLGPGGITDLAADDVVNENIILVNNINWAASRNGRQVVPGKTGVSASGKTILVKRVYQYKANIIAIEVAASAPVKVSDVFRFSFVPNISVTGRQIMNGNFSSNYKLFADDKRISKLKYSNQ